jgi:hypothetical protein
MNQTNLEKGTFNRISSEDQLMLESPHGTPVKKVGDDTRLEISMRTYYYQQDVGEITTQHLSLTIGLTTDDR